MLLPAHFNFNFREHWLDLSNDNFLTVASLLGRDDLATALRVSEAWNAVLEGSEHLWASMCQRVWASKSYVPPSLRAMAGGQTAMEEAGVEERLQLTALKISQLKDKMRSLSCRVRVADLLEKKDFVDVIVDAQRQATANGTVAEKLLGQPGLLVRDGESPPKAALRLSIEDAATRTAITAAELMAFSWSVRLRRDGPLAQAADMDPWWQGKGCGSGKFRNDGRVSLTWPTDPETGTAMDLLYRW